MLYNSDNNALDWTNRVRAANNAIQQSIPTNITPMFNTIPKSVVEPLKAIKTAEFFDSSKWVKLPEYYKNMWLRQQTTRQSDYDEMADGVKNSIGSVIKTTMVGDFEPLKAFATKLRSQGVSYADSLSKLTKHVAAMSKEARDSAASTLRGYMPSFPGLDTNTAIILAALFVAGFGSYVIYRWYIDQWRNQNKHGLTEPEIIDWLKTGDQKTQCKMLLEITTAFMPPSTRERPAGLGLKRALGLEKADKSERPELSFAERATFMQAYIKEIIALRGVKGSNGERLALVYGPAPKFLAAIKAGGIENCLGYTDALQKQNEALKKYYDKFGRQQATPAEDAQMKESAARTREFYDQRAAISLKAFASSSSDAEKLISAMGGLENVLTNVELRNVVFRMAMRDPMTREKVFASQATFI
jgi:hypothetical protein